MEDLYIFTLKDLADLYPNRTEQYIGSIVSMYKADLKPVKKKGFRNLMFYNQEALDLFPSLFLKKRENLYKKTKQPKSELVHKIPLNINDYVIFNTLIKNIEGMETISKPSLNAYLFNFVESFKFEKTLYIHKKDIERTISMTKRYIDENNEYVPNLFVVYEIRKTKDGQLVLIHKETHDAKATKSITTIEEIKNKINN